MAYSTRILHPKPYKVQTVFPLTRHWGQDRSRETLEIDLSSNGNRCLDRVCFADGCPVMSHIPHLYIRCIPLTSAGRLILRKLRRRVQNGWRATPCMGSELSKTLLRHRLCSACRSENSGTGSAMKSALRFSLGCRDNHTHSLHTEYASTWVRLYICPCTGQARE